MAVKRDPIEARAKRKANVDLRHRLNYQKVLLAVYYLADEDDERRCSATNGDIANHCGLSIEAVRRAIREMQSRGLLDTFDWRDGICFRTHVLTDHPRAADLIDELSRYKRYDRQGA